jgi:hypothetical protein
MNELTERLTVEQPIVMGGADPTVAELRERTGEMGYVLVKSPKRAEAPNWDSRCTATPPISARRTSTRVPGPCTSRAI